MIRWKYVAPAALLLLLVFVGPGVWGRLHRLPTLTYTQLLQAMDAGRVADLTIQPGERILGQWTRATGAARVRDEGYAFEVVFPQASADAVVARAERAGVPVSFAPPPDYERYKDWLGIALPLLLVGGTFLFLMLNVRKQGGNGDVGREIGGTATTFKDVAGTQGAAEELHEVVEFLRAPAAFLRMGAQVPKGVLLVGPPGTGKTLLARAVAGEAGVPFFHVSGSEITGFIVGLGAHRIRTLFKKARKKGGVIFIDELDVLGGTRGKNGSHNEDDRTLNQLLVELDGFSPRDGVVVLGATNRPEALDKALKRPGRFDRTVTVGLPAVDGREAILRLHAERRGVPLAEDIDFSRLARLTPGASGAELANLLNEAAIAAVREEASSVAWRHVEIARDRMLLGKERIGFRAQQHEWRIVAYHEAGHALTGVLCSPEDGLHKVTIQPRGQAMGVAFFSPEDDRHLHSRRYLEAQIVKGLGGRAAEELVFGPDQITSGAESDLVQVNRIARKMIYRLGMGGNTGFLVYDDQGAPLSAQAQAAMDAEVRDLLSTLYGRSKAILEQHRAALEALAQALLERETVDGAEALAIFRAHGVTLPGALTA
ncbi:MAG TPA: AAA family ATPase [Longimicrobiales bacterium]|nr:AAA family ATPase [Longimicrobiales bacterium]